MGPRFALVTQIVSSSELAANYHGIYTVRKAATATALQRALASAPTAHPYDTLDSDFSKLLNVRKVAASINTRVADGELPPIRALTLNAGYQEHRMLSNWGTT
ncbi:uncharacterized protein Z518_07827 [Rhinocladiella mackenziei CBS 650.93]|uniref:Ketoreductase (KR) domain-containing protein n=1 Tax=Rhinocladiella mackenziei CBS 650.93 TaxID=1442369 RepID=A0A0D2GU98_9EURO|nr:uncharacterized protein Z518_07827 [Rhinocladiella mackenziei CBS 650.93]KIX01888.1 hypothetical protein Z518_07827 [Rhinocladiella mackenziei CBS 650.93]